MNVNIQGAPIYFEIPILGGIPITATLVVSWGVMLVLTLVCIWLTHDLKVRNISKRQAIAEKIVITAQNFVRNNMGEAWMRYVPFVSTIFAMSIFSSLSRMSRPRSRGALSYSSSLHIRSSGPTAFLAISRASATPSS